MFTFTILVFHRLSKAKSGEPTSRTWNLVSGTPMLHLFHGGEGHHRTQQSLFVPHSRTTHLYLLSVIDGLVGMEG